MEKRPKKNTIALPPEPTVRPTVDEKIAALRRLTVLHLPVGSVKRMKRESVSDGKHWTC